MKKTLTTEPPVVLTINAEECKSLRRMVDLLAAVQVCWPDAQAEYDNGQITVTVRRVIGTGALAA